MVLAKAAISTGASVASLGESFITVASVAAGANISIEETTAALGVLGDMNRLGAVSGTQLKIVIQRLKAPIGDGAKALAKLGLSTKEVSSITAGLAAGMINLKAGLAKIKDPHEKAAITARLFGTEAEGTGTALTRNLKTFQAYIKMLQETGVASKQASIRSDNLNGDFLSLLSAVESLTIKTGDDGLKGVFRKITQQITTVVRALVGNKTAFDSLGAAGKKIVTVIKKIIEQSVFLLDALFGNEEAFDKLGVTGKRFFSFIKGTIDQLGILIKMLLGVSDETDKLNPHIQSTVNFFKDLAGIVSVIASPIDALNKSFSSSRDNEDGLDKKKFLGANARFISQIFGGDNENKKFTTPNDETVNGIKNVAGLFSANNIEDKTINIANPNLTASIDNPNVTANIANPNAALAGTSTARIDGKVNVTITNESAQQVKSIESSGENVEASFSRGFNTLVAAQ